MKPTTEHVVAVGRPLRLVTNRAAARLCLTNANTIATVVSVISRAGRSMVVCMSWGWHLLVRTIFWLRKNSLITSRALVTRAVTPALFRIGLTVVQMVLMPRATVIVTATEVQATSWLVCPWWMTSRSIMSIYTSVVMRTRAT